MQVSLGNFIINIEFTDSEIKEHLDIIFRGWPALAEDHGTDALEEIVQGQGPSCRVYLEIADTEIAEPDGDIIGSEVLHPLNRFNDHATIYKKADRYTLFFQSGALIEIPSIKPRTAGAYEINALISREQMRADRLEDILFAGLAPIMRQEGFFLSHAFAVTFSGRSLLMVGPSNSGKTTAGLSLVLAGWGFLSNDVAILKKEGSQIIALPVPGTIGLSSKTVELLSADKTRHRWKFRREITGKHYVPAKDVIPSWSRPEPVAIVVFPVIVGKETSQLKSIDKSVALARLVESSIDRWDKSMMERHFDLLYELSVQSECLELTIGRDVIEWPGMLGTFL